MSIRPVHGYKLGQQLCELFGLDAQRIEQITITCNVNDVVKVEVFYIDLDCEAQEFVDEFARYRLVEE